MITLEEIETKHHFTFPDFFRKLWDNGMLNYMKGVEEGQDWEDTVYPKLRENPPILLHSGEAGLKIFTPEEMLDFQTPPFWDAQVHHLIPFAKTLEGNYFAFYDNVKVEGEAPVVEVWDEMDDAEYYAKNFEDFIFRQMVESATDIDPDDHIAEHDDIDGYIADVHRDIASVTPYLKTEYIAILNDIYGRTTQKNDFSFSLISIDEAEKIVKENMDFELLGESFSHEF